MVKFFLLSILAFIISFTGCSYNNYHGGLLDKSVESKKQKSTKYRIRRIDVTQDKIGKVIKVYYIVESKDISLYSSRWVYKYADGYTYHTNWEEKEDPLDKLLEDMGEKSKPIWLFVQNKQVKFKSFSKYCTVSVSNNGFTDGNGVVTVTATTKDFNIRFAKLQDELDNSISIIKNKVNTEAKKIFNLNALKRDNIKIYYSKLAKGYISNINDEGYKLSYEDTKEEIAFGMINIKQAVNLAVSASINETTARISRYVKSKYFVKVQIIPSDINSRYPFGGSMIDIAYISRYPNYRKLLSKYIKDKTTIENAGTYFADISPMKSSGDEQTYFTLYTKGKYKLNIKNRKYYFLEKTIGLKNNKTKITVYMSELGTKHRVKFIYE